MLEGLLVQVMDDGAQVRWTAHVWPPSVEWTVDLIWFPAPGWVAQTAVRLPSGAEERTTDIALIPQGTVRSDHDAPPLAVNHIGATLVVPVGLKTGLARTYAEVGLVRTSQVWPLAILPVLRPSAERVAPGGWVGVGVHERPPSKDSRSSMGHPAIDSGADFEKSVSIIHTEWPRAAMDKTMPGWGLGVQLFPLSWVTKS